MKYIEFKVGDVVRLLPYENDDGVTESTDGIEGGVVTKVDYSKPLAVGVSWPNGDLSVHTVEDLARGNEDVRIVNPCRGEAKVK